MSGSSSAAVALPFFGMAGLIHTDCDSASVRGSDSWLDRCFPWTACSVVRRCQGQDITVVTSQHSHEVQLTPGVKSLHLEMSPTGQGLVFGNILGMHGGDSEPTNLGKRIFGDYAARGLEAFRDLNGAWAGVHWNRLSRTALFVRDEIGVEVLYVARLPGRIVFATDLRLLWRAGIPARLDTQAIGEFLHYLYVPAPRTIVRDCHAVLPGHLLTVDAEIRQERYSIPRFSRGHKLRAEADFDTAVNASLPEFESRLLAAVESCLPATGRVALMLSGGKDSSTLAIALSKLCPERVVAVTVGQVDQTTDESSDAALVCRSLRIPHICYVPSDADLVTGLSSFVRSQDQPIGDPSALPYYLALARLPDDCALIVDGSGNDYYFGIPSAAKGHWQYQLRRKTQAIVPQRLWPTFLKLMALGPSGMRNLARHWSRPIEESFVAWHGWSCEELSLLLDRPFALNDTYLWGVMRDGHARDWIDLLTEVICHVWEPHAAIRKGVQFARAVGRGIRFPFMDKRLSEFVNSLPTELKVRDGVNKQILRAYMRRNLPREIVEKPKQGFIFDLNRLLMKPRGLCASELQSHGTLQFMPNLSQQTIEILRGRHNADPSDPRWQQRLYALCLLVSYFDVVSCGHQSPSPLVH